MPTKNSKSHTPSKKSSARAKATARIQERPRMTERPKVARSDNQRSQSRFPGETPLTGEDRPSNASGGKKRGSLGK